MNSAEKSAYRKTAKWKLYREHKIKQSNCTCSLCGMVKKKGLHLHHINPQNYGCETDSDTVVLCYTCHRFVELKWKTLQKKNTLDALALFNIIKFYHSN